MAKKRCKVTFIYPEEETPEGSGIYKPVKAERYYRVDVLDNGRTLQAGTGTNENVQITNHFSMIADPYATKNFSMIRAIKWRGVQWTVKTVSVEYPRLILQIGGVWNG